MGFRDTLNCSRVEENARLTVLMKPVIGEIKVILFCNYLCISILLFYSIIHVLLLSMLF